MTVAIWSLLTNGLYLMLNTMLYSTPVGLKRVNQVCTIRYIPYQAKTLLRYQQFDNHLDKEPRVGTPICQSLVCSEFTDFDFAFGTIVEI